MYKSLLCCRLRSPNALKTPMASLVPIPFRKPNCFIGNPIYCSCFSLNSFSQNLKYDFRGMWYQTNSLIVLTFCCVCFYFYSGIITVCRKSLGHSPIVYIRWHISLSIPLLPSRQGTSARHFNFIFAVTVPKRKVFFCCSFLSFSLLFGLLTDKSRTCRTTAATRCDFLRDVSHPTRLLYLTMTTYVSRPCLSDCQHIFNISTRCWYTRLLVVSIQIQTSN